MDNINIEFSEYKGLSNSFQLINENNKIIVIHISIFFDEYIKIGDYNYAQCSFYCYPNTINKQLLSNNAIVVINSIPSKEHIKILESLSESYHEMIYEKVKDLKGQLVNYLNKRFRPQRIEDLLND